ncbi:pyridoxamine 5'-phosphate oxidase family protein [Mycolicibacterium pallens]|uniref:Pyridoxamine 5'-phosphate oxidase family protein n=1 Tax=Mycolicibacterium pallens TaxID=370524 RepID=A0ABX8VN91_9MYCO|nr:pyridoxamine 5'-phosphate oxidase family protein [Mycolicibacterium pallens]QYL19255.1 pyridoxamine 5'-phosphate oxidase family protein [Mycolicibacterium pallens]
MTAETLSPQDLSFLARPLCGFFSTAAGASPPQPRPVWFEVTTNGHVQLFTGSDTPKVRQLRRDPRASLVVAAPVGERERWVSVAGPTTLASDGAWELVERLAARYWDLDDPIRAQDLAQMRDEDWLRVIIEPEIVRRYAM